MKYGNNAKPPNAKDAIIKGRTGTFCPNLSISNTHDIIKGNNPRLINITILSGFTSCISKRNMALISTHVLSILLSGAKKKV